jgi:hypothetical protein
VFGQRLVRETPSAPPCVTLRCSTSGAHVAPSSSTATGTTPSRCFRGYARPRQQGSQVSTSEASTPSRCPLHPRPSAILLSSRILHRSFQLALRFAFRTLIEIRASPILTPNCSKIIGGCKFLVTMGISSFVNSPIQYISTFHSGRDCILNVNG